MAHVETGIPTMAVTTLGQLAAWQWPREVRHLTAITEDDDRGRQVEILAARMRASRP